MKRFWLVLLSLGLIVAFSTSAMAVDVKFSGEYYAAGMYIDKGKYIKNDIQTDTSTAFFFQRLRLSTVFVVSPGLMLTTRADIMERSWGAARSNVPLVTPLDDLSAGTRAENENIAFDLAYITYISPIGIFLAGYQIDGAWGTVFGDSSLPTGKVGYMFRSGGVTLGLQTGKNTENSRTTLNPAVDATDRDSSFYTAYGVYSWKGGNAGLLGKYIRSATSRALLGGDNGFLTNLYVIIPYVKAQLGPVAVQAELYHMFGQLSKFEGSAVGGLGDTRVSQLSAWVDATADFGKAYVGATGAYVSGDDPGTTASEGGLLTGGKDWNPCLLLFNYDKTYWAGAYTGANGTSDGNPMTNSYFAQLRAGVRPMDKLDVMLAGSWAHADKTPSGTWQSRDYGYEVDLTATYKITNNLSYMLGGGYLITGDFFKGINAAGTESVRDNFLVINKLTLTF